MTKKWSPADIQKVMAVSSACSCMVILVGSVSIGVVMGKISSDLLGSVKGIGVGGGLVGLAMVLYLVIRVALKPGAKDPQPAAGDS
jgi:hypothetical protein